MTSLPPRPKLSDFAITDEEWRAYTLGKQASEKIARYYEAQDQWLAKLRSWILEPLPNEKNDALPVAENEDAVRSVFDR